MSHPTLTLNNDVSAEDYTRLNRKPPSIKKSLITAVTDTGAQSCLWGLQNYLNCGFSKNDLIPVKHNIYANRKRAIS